MKRRSAAAGLFLLPLVAATLRADEPPPASVEAPRFGLQLLLSDLEPLRDRDDRKAELYYAAISAEWRRKGWGARAELRGREGRFRAYYPGDVWLEEGYGFAETPVGELRLGKLERAFGLPDETFSGTLFSSNGVTRNPDWGVGLSGDKKSGWNTFSWWAAYFGRNDRIAWEDDGRGVESDPAATLRDGFEARVAYHLNKGLWSVKPGVSFATARIVRDAGDEFRRTDGAADVTATFGPLSVMIEALVRRGETPGPADPGRLAYDDAVAGLFGFRAEFPSVTWRYVYSEWRYQGADTNERIHQPGVVFTPRKGISGTIELIARRMRGPSSARAVNAIRFGLTLVF